MTAPLRLPKCLFAAVLVLAAGLLLASLPVPQAMAQTLARKGWAGSGLTVRPWYSSAVFYQIDPISFQDSNGDGFGDLNGIAERLDYLQSLGVDALVLSPFALAPEVDDKRADTLPAADSAAFDPAYGTVDDFDRLLAECSRRHLRVLVDLPLESMRTPAVAAAAGRLWLTRGVAGLRVTANATSPANRHDQWLSAPELRARLDAVREAMAGAPGTRVLLLDLPPGEGAAADAPTGHHGAHTSVPQGARHASTDHGRAGHPQVAELDVRRQPDWSTEPTAPGLAAAFADAHLAQLSGAAPGSTDSPAHLAAHSPAHFPVLVTDTPDQVRSVSRGQPGDLGAAASEGKAKILAAVLMLTPAAPMLYFGQELGMANGAGGQPPLPTPMQWGGDAHGASGFSAGVPWVEMGPNAATANVQAEDATPDSLLSWYRALSSLRRGHASLRDGRFALLPTPAPGVVAWVRSGAEVGGSPGAPVVVVVNLSAQTRVVSLTIALAGAGISRGSLRTLLASDGRGVVASRMQADSDSDLPPVVTVPALSTGRLSLPPLGVYAGELTTQRGLESEATPVSRSRSRGR